MGSALGWMKGRLRRQDPSGEAAPDQGLKAGPAELEMELALQEMAELDRQLAAETISLEAYRPQWTELEEPMQNRPNAQTP